MLKNILNKQSIARFLVLILLIFPAVAFGSKLDDLNAKKAALENEAKQLEAQSSTQQNIAQRANVKIQQVENQIESLNELITETEDGISSTTSQISQKNQEVAGLESDLRRISDQQNALVRQLYIMSQSMPDSLTLFSNEPLNQRQIEEQRFSALKASVAAVFAKTSEAKKTVEKNRDDLKSKNEQLNMLHNQQDSQKQGLADFQSQQAQLKYNAEAAVVQLTAKAKKDRDEMSKVEQQIFAEVAALKANSQGYFGSGPGVGLRVKRGDYVGIQGSTGYSTGDHVHFEVDLAGPARGYTNPRPYVNSGELSWPLKSFVETQDYGYTSYARSGAYGGAPHTGIDISGPIGSPVFAPADGVVVMNQYFGGYGNAWVMKVDDGPYVLLGHLRK